MRTFRKQIAQAASIAALGLLMCACGHENPVVTPVDELGDAVNFSATQVGETRTAFSGTVTDGKERLDWKSGDLVTVWSDKADDHSANKINFANYAATADGTANGAKSTAPLAVNAGTPLKWHSGDDTYQFWAVYPAGNVTVAKSGNLADVTAPSFTATIPATQAISAHTYSDGIVKLEPSMDYAYMVSYLSTTKVDKVTLPFDPAFTAFEITVKSADSELELKSFTLTSDNDKNVAGGFTGTYTGGKWAFAEGSSLSKTATLNFPLGTTISTDKELTFTVFALPQDLDALKLSFTIKDGNSEVTKTLPLKQDGSYLSFDGCKKHRIGVLAIPSGWKFSVITLNLQAMDWEAIAKTTDEYAQATQFEITGATEDASTRQLWHVAVGGEATITYKVFLPEGGTWSIVPAGDVTSFTITGTTSGTVASGGSRITLKVTPNSGSSGKQLYFNTYVEKDGVKYNLDSETQLYDMRGYHILQVN